MASVDVPGRGSYRGGEGLRSDTVAVSPGRPRTFTVGTEVIGKGYRSVVKLATCDQTLEPVVAKITHKHRLSKGGLESLQLEEEILRYVESCSHGSYRFVKLLAREETETEIIMFMEFILGGELFAVCNPYKYGMPEEEVLLKSLAYKIFTAVALLHSYGVVHLDLKLENIMYHPDTGRCTLLDFGFAKYNAAINNEGKLEPVLHKSFCGSTHYVAPELIRQQPFDGEKADVWSLGVLLFAMATGQFPFDDRYDIRVVIYNKILREEISYPTSLSLELTLLLKRMLSRTPQARPSLTDILVNPWFTSLFSRG